MVKDVIVVMLCDDVCVCFYVDCVCWLFMLLYFGGLCIIEVVDMMMGWFFCCCDVDGYECWWFDVMGKGGW